MANFVQLYKDNINKVCLVYSETFAENFGSANLFWCNYTTAENQIREGLFCFTARHVLDLDGSPFFSVVVNINFYNNVISTPGNPKYDATTKVLTFTCIGYDNVADLAIGFYNPDLEQNKVNGQTVNYQSADANQPPKNWVDAYPFYNIIDQTLGNHIGASISVIGQNLWDNESFSNGIIKDASYSGQMDQGEMPECILGDISTYKGSSGSAILNNSGEVVGMINGGFDKYYDHITYGLCGKLINIIAKTIIDNFFSLNETIRNNQTSISAHISRGYAKAYLGIEHYHFNQVDLIEHKQLRTILNNIGGLMITQFVKGLNILDEEWIFDFEIHPKTVAIMNPFHFNVSQITLGSDQNVNQVLENYKMTKEQLYNLNPVQGQWNLPNGTVLNIIDPTRMNTKIWDIFHNTGKGQYPLLFTRLWFTKKNLNGSIVWTDLALGKFSGQRPLSDFSYQLARDIETLPNGNKVYKYRSDGEHINDLEDISNVDITTKTDIWGNPLTRGDIVIEFYYTENGSVWQGPVYEKIKPFVIFPTLEGQNNRSYPVLNVETPVIFTPMEVMLSLESYNEEDYNDLVEFRPRGSKKITTSAYARGGRSKQSAYARGGRSKQSAYARGGRSKKSAYARGGRSKQ